MRTMLSLCLIILCMTATVSGKATSNKYGYLVTTPSRWFTNNANNLCVTFQPRPPKMTISIGFGDFFKDAEVPDVTKDFTSDDEQNYCMPVEVPAVASNAGVSLPATLTLAIKGMESDEEGAFGFKEEVQVKLVDRAVITLIHTSKPLYKPGEIVQFRVTTFDSDLRRVSGNDDFMTYDEVWIEDAQKTRIQQWTDLPIQRGIASGELQLSSEPRLGSWVVATMVNGVKVKSTFEVKEYVLPRFEVTIETDKKTFAGKNFTATVCGKYSYGKPVSGRVTVSMKLKSRWGWREESGEANNVHNFTRKTNGCEVFSVPVKNFSPYTADMYYQQLEISADLTEDGTDITLSNKAQSQVTTDPVTLDFSPALNYFKPGLPYFGMLKVTHANGKPAVDEPVKISLSRSSFHWWSWRSYSHWWGGFNPTQEIDSDESVGKTYRSDAMGRVYFDLPPLTDNQTRISITAHATDRDTQLLRKEDYITKGAVIVNKTSTTTHSVRQWFSPSKSYIQMQPVTENVECGQTVNINVSLSVPDTYDYDVYFQVLAKSKMVYMASANLKASLSEGEEAPVDDGSGPKRRLFRRRAQVPVVEDLIVPEVFVPLEVDVDVDVEQELEFPDNIVAEAPWPVNDDNLTSEDEDSVTAGPAPNGLIDEDIVQERTFPPIVPVVMTGPPNPFEKISLKPIANTATSVRNFVLQVPIDHRFQPKFRILAYFVRSDMEVVADSTEIKVTPCFQNQVSVAFSPPTVAPGNDVTLTIRAAPGSQCSVGVIDKSVQLLAGGGSLDPAAIFDKVQAYINRLPYPYFGGRWGSDRDYCEKWLQKYQLGYTGEGKLETPERYGYFSPDYDYTDSMEAFEASQSNSVSFMSSAELVLQMKPCDPVDRRMMSAAMPDGAMAAPPGARARGNVGGGRGSSDADDGVEVRDFFPESWIWALFDMGKMDEFVETRPAPHTITNWVGTAFCVSDKDGLGVAPPAEFTTFRPFYISLTLPYSLVRGESLFVPIKVFNYLTGCINVKVSVGESTGFTVNGDSANGVCVCGSKAKATGFVVVPSRLGTVNITVRGEVTEGDDTCMTEDENVIGKQDTVVRPLLIKAEGIEMEETLSTFFCTAEPDYNPDESTCNVKRREAKQELTDLINDDVAVDSFHIPQCGPDGSFKPMQSMNGMNGWTRWCVDVNGQQIDGTSMDDLNFNDWIKCPKHVPESSTASYETEIALNLPGDVVEGSTRAFMYLIGDLLGPSMQGIGSLVKKPYGCGEQNMVNFSPISSILDYLDGTNQLTSQMETKAKAFMEQGYQRELKYRHNDGSYSAFGAGRDKSGSTWLTAFVLRSFEKAKSQIYIDAKDVQKSRDLLIRQQQPDGCWREMGRLFSKSMQGGSGSGENSAPLTAYVLISLLENGDSSEIEAYASAFECLASRKDETPYTMALKTYAYALRQTKEATQLANEYLEILMESAVQDGLKIYWEAMPGSQTKKCDYYYCRAPTYDVEMTSYVLLSWIKLRPDDAVSAGLSIVKWLTSQRNAYGGFSSTQDTVMAMQALSEYAKLAYTGNIDLKVEVSDKESGDIQVTFKVSEDNRLVVDEGRIGELPRTLNVKATGMGCAVLLSTSRYNIEDIETPEPQFEIEVSTQNVAATGDYCRYRGLDICVRYTGDDAASQMAVVEVGVPSGWRADTESIKRLYGVTELSHFKRFEVDKEGKLQFYFDELRHTTTCYDFLLEREFEVNNTRPAYVKAYDYYETDLQITAEYEIGECSIDESVFDNAMPYGDYLKVRDNYYETQRNRSIVYWQEWQERNNVTGNDTRGWYAPVIRRVDWQDAPELMISGNETPLIPDPPLDAILPGKDGDMEKPTLEPGWTVPNAEAPVKIDEMNSDTNEAENENTVDVEVEAEIEGEPAVIGEAENNEESSSDSIMVEEPQASGELTFPEGPEALFVEVVGEGQLGPEPSAVPMKDTEPADPATESDPEIDEAAVDIEIGMDNEIVAQKTAGTMLVADDEEATAGNDVIEPDEIESDEESDEMSVSNAENAGAGTDSESSPEEGDETDDVEVGTATEMEVAGDMEVAADMGAEADMEAAADIPFKQVEEPVATCPVCFEETLTGSYIEPGPFVEKFCSSKQALKTYVQQPKIVRIYADVRPEAGKKRLQRSVVINLADECTCAPLIEGRKILILADKLVFDAEATAEFTLNGSVTIFPLADGERTAFDIIKHGTCNKNKQ